MMLRQTFDNPINGWWDGGVRSVFDWRIDGTPLQDRRGWFVKVGSLAANRWFHVAVGKTDKQTLGNAHRRLAAGMKRVEVTCTFEYIEEQDNA